MTSAANTDPADILSTLLGGSYGSERDAVVALLDLIQVAESCAGTALAAWGAQCKIPALRGGLRMIAEREAYHGRIFSDRVRALGGACRAELSAFSRQAEAYIYDEKLSDTEKLTLLVQHNGDATRFLQPILAFAESLTEDAETKELLKLYCADEFSSDAWFREMERVLAGGTATVRSAA